ncbi:MAG: type II toxin-antitoxin system RelE/ParE family toxin [Nanoarchaeota archaeon]|nr:type II toxin-antitoxin system RelE/ParE family toxin [Nanoarchaeota archaeon]MBU1854767.1 type II toxin-antitoxin system RelE/ParE family toxin [Nanoarchaeota archaeon]
MIYNLIFDKVAIEQLNKLPKNIRSRIFKKLQDSKNNPFHFFERLTNKKTYKLRVGNYRIIADIQKRKIAILVLYVGHRKNIYSS